MYNGFSCIQSSLRWNLSNHGRTSSALPGSNCAGNRSVDGPLCRLVLFGKRRAFFRQGDAHQQSPLPTRIFTSGSINLAYFYRGNGELILGKAFVLEPPRDVLPLDGFDVQMQNNNLAFITHRSPTSAKPGIVLTEVGPMLVASLPILNDEPNNTVCGTLVMGRLLSEQRLANFSLQVRLSTNYGDCRREQAVIAQRAGA